jgi:hypothetical protein
MKNNGKGRVPYHTRLLVYETWGYICVYCGEKAESLDHLVPASKWGRHEPANLRPACIDCNSKKGDRDPISWLGDQCPPELRGVTLKERVKAKRRRIAHSRKVQIEVETP